ncbi:MAG: hypothetical protein KatS3mg052_0085 [Candidatus Roseilinea sp.]|nr:MAG: hypothetical protein KatS3mg052_0085 [Candidatus Roseilinea sp.]
MQEKTRNMSPTVAAATGDARGDREPFTGAAGHDHAQAHEPHMPAPSLSPIILGGGMTLAAFGIVLHPVMLALGIVGILVGLGTWLYDEIVNASSVTSDHASDGRGEA